MASRDLKRAASGATAGPLYVAIREVETLEIMLDFVASAGLEGVPFITPDNAVKMRDAVRTVLEAARLADTSEQAARPREDQGQ